MPDVQLMLSQEEKSYLQRVLEHSIPSKRVEIHHTDRRAYRHELEHEVEFIEALLAKIKAAG
jgi:hypothetical protein